MTMVPVLIVMATLLFIFALSIQDKKQASSIMILAALIVVVAITLLTVNHFKSEPIKLQKESVKTGAPAAQELSPVYVAPAKPPQDAPEKPSPMLPAAVATPLPPRVQAPGLQAHPPAPRRVQRAEIAAAPRGKSRVVEHPFQPCSVRTTVLIPDQFRNTAMNVVCFEVELNGKPYRSCAKFDPNGPTEQQITAGNFPCVTQEQVGVVFGSQTEVRID